MQDEDVLYDLSYQCEAGNRRRQSKVSLPSMTERASPVPSDNGGPAGTPSNGELDGHAPSGKDAAREGARLLTPPAEVAAEQPESPPLSRRLTQVPAAWVPPQKQPPPEAAEQSPPPHDPPPQPGSPLDQALLSPASSSQEVPDFVSEAPPQPPQSPGKDAEPAAVPLDASLPSFTLETMAPQPPKSSGTADTDDDDDDDDDDDVSLADDSDSGLSDLGVPDPPKPTVDVAPAEPAQPALSAEQTPSGSPGSSPRGARRLPSLPPGGSPLLRRRVTLSENASPATTRKLLVK